MSEIHSFSPKQSAAPLLIQTKLNRPRLGQNLILRKRLEEKLDRGFFCKLTLVTAPAGFGKSTLVAHWVSKNKKPAAWLSLDKGDNDVMVFWSYFINAVKSIHPQLGRQSLDFLHSSTHLHIEKVLSVLINETNQHKEDFAIILDDFHVITDSSVYKSLQYFLDHLPPRLHVYIVSRTSPSLPLGGLRAKGHLLELTVNDLRFNLKENKAFFDNTLNDICLSQKELLTLNQRLEGWVAGMQMVSVILNSTQRKSSFINNFSGDQQHFVEYFQEEILQHQPEAVKQFLLQTSILQRMNASLCNKLTGGSNSQEVLEWLEKINLFLIPLDEQRCWYRYHHLFARLLKFLLKQQKPDCLPQLHQKAGTWFKNNGFSSEAIYHTLEGQDYEKAAKWIEEEASRIFKAGELSTLAYWINSLPKESLYRRPRLWLYYSWILIQSRKIKEADSTCMEIMNFLSDTNRLTLVEDKSMLDFIKSEAYMIAGYIALLEDKPGAPEMLIEAMKKIRPDSLAEMITFNPGNASLLQADTGKRGRLKEVAHFYNSTLHAIKKIGEFASFAVGFINLSEIHYETNNWDEAQKYIQMTLKMGKAKLDLGVLTPAYITASKIKTEQGESYAALELLNTLEKEIHDRGCYNWFSIIQACKARIAIKMNDREAVQSWTNSCELSVYDEITILQYYPFCTLIRALLYLGQPYEALQLAERMVVLLDEEGGVGQQIEILLLQALCCQALDNKERALSSLEKALQLGAAEGYYRIFVDEGKELFELLIIFRTQQMLLPAEKRCEKLLEYTGKLFNGFVKENIAGTEHDPKLSLEMKESLTRREWEVLMLLAEGFSNQAIAEALFISVVTVKTHVQNICRKLNVKSRAKAIARINELNLLSIYDRSGD